jgi:HAD superfamily hydrolase (TIGR01490 family)
VRLQGAQAAEQAHARYMHEVIMPNIRASALELVQTHRQAGDTVMIVTATNEFVTRPIAQAFGVSELIAVELERDASGWITGEIKGTPSFREGKVQRVTQWLAARGLGWDDVDMTFYSDSPNDLPLLERAHYPVATNPDTRLRDIALARGWRVLELFEQ